VSESRAGAPSRRDIPADLIDRATMKKLAAGRRES